MRTPKNGRQHPNELDGRKNQLRIEVESLYRSIFGTTPHLTNDKDSLILEALTLQELKEKHEHS